jgi:hypothetical protein
MAVAKQKSSDFGAAMAGLVLGGSVLFLLILAIVWLTNAKFAGHEAPVAHSAPAAAPATAPAAGSAQAPPAPALH